MQSAFTPRNSDYEALTRASFARQAVMTLIGAEMTSVTPGATEIVLPTRDDRRTSHNNTPLSGLVEIVVTLTA
jgi:acyl-coenzyme A thioesterase PaaI-like protein